MPISKSASRPVFGDVKAHKNLDESVAGARVVGNGFDGPRVASSYFAP